MTENTIKNDYIIITHNKDLFKNISDIKELQNKAYDYILNGNKNYKTIIDTIDNKKIEFRRISAKEYVYGRNSRIISQGDNNNIGYYKKKLRLSPFIDELIYNSNISYHSPLNHESKLFQNGFNNFQGNIIIDKIKFRYIVRIGKAKNDNIFYDVSLVIKD